MDMRSNSFPSIFSEEVSLLDEIETLAEEAGGENENQSSFSLAGMFRNELTINDSGLMRNQNARQIRRRREPPGLPPRNRRQRTGNLTIDRTESRRLRARPSRAQAERARHRTLMNNFSNDLSNNNIETTESNVQVEEIPGSRLIRTPMPPRRLPSLTTRLRRRGYRNALRFPPTQQPETEEIRTSPIHRRLRMFRDSGSELFRENSPQLRPMRSTDDPNLPGVYLENDDPFFYEFMRRRANNRVVGNFNARLPGSGALLPNDPLDLSDILEGIPLPPPTAEFASNFTRKATRTRRLPMADVVEE